jgi:hypothetical protein
MSSKPYSIEDLQRPDTEGRSLHDEASTFYREIMKIQTHIVTVVPSKADIAKAIQAMTKAEAEKSGPLLLNLQVNTIEESMACKCIPTPTNKRRTIVGSSTAGPKKYSCEAGYLLPSIDKKVWRITRCKEVD